MTDIKDTSSSSTILRENITTGLSYPDLVAAFERQLGRLDPAAMGSLVHRNAPWREVEQEIQRQAGPHGLMILFVANQGALISLWGVNRRCTLYLVGNPIIAERILRVDVRAALYVPFRVCLYDDGAPGGAVMSFDRPSSFLAALNRPELDEIGVLLDSKIDGVVRTVLANPA